MVAITFFLLAIYVTWDAVKSPIIAPVGIILAVFSLAVVPTLPSPSSGSAKRWEAAPWSSDSKETSVCSYLSLTMLLGVGGYTVVGGGGLTLLVRSRYFRSSSGRDGRRCLKRASQQTTKIGVKPMKAHKHAAAVKIRSLDPA